MESCAQGLNGLVSLTMDAQDEGKQSPQGGLLDAVHGATEPEEKLWGDWKRERSGDTRSALLALHLPYARIVAASYYSKRMNEEIEFADYHQLASIGLLEAFDRFDPDVGVQFRTFAARRMHGAILNGLERLTEKQQQLAFRRRLEGQRRASIKGEKFAEPGKSDEKDDASSGAQLLRYVADVGLSFALAWILDGTGMLDTGDTATSLPFYRNVELRELRQRIIDLVGALPAQERIVIQHHYFQEQPFEAIALSLSLTRGRVSQIHRRALSRLGESLKGQNCDLSL